MDYSFKYSLGITIYWILVIFALVSEIIILFLAREDISRLIAAKASPHIWVITILFFFIIAAVPYGIGWLIRYLLTGIKKP